MIDLAVHIERVARHLLGKPNEALSKGDELRFGKNGSVSVIISGPKRGTWYDHENRTGGGVRELLLTKGGVRDDVEIAAWFKDTLGIDLHAADAGKRHIVATYDYVDEEGLLLFQVLRWGPAKTFSQQQPGSGKGGIKRDPKTGKPTMQGARYVPYHLDELAAATKTGNGHGWRVYITEGEKDADRLRQWGLTATTNAGGVGKWRRDYGRYFTGAEVVILEDHDPPNKQTGKRPGREHVADVARKLAPFATVIKIPELRLPEGKDISDWIADGGSQSNLEDLVDSTEPYQPTGEAKPDPDPGTDQRLSLGFWLDRELDPPDFLLGEVLSTTTRAMMFAPTGIGKTNIALAIAIDLANGKGFLHWHGRGRPARVLFIDGEMSRRLMKQRVIDGVHRHGAAPASLFILSREDFPDMPPLNTPEGQQFIDGIIEKIGGVDFIVFDNIQALISGDMKEEDGWADTLPWIRDLTRRNIGQLWVHHTGHNENQAYGTKTREWQLDTVIKLERAEDETEDDADLCFTLSFTKARERTPDNRNDFEPAKITLRDHRWESTRHSRNHQRGNVSPKGCAFLDALGNTLAKCGTPRPHSGNRPSVTMDEWRGECGHRGVLDLDKKDSSRSLFSQYRLELIAAAKIACNGDYVWRP